MKTWTEWGVLLLIVANFFVRNLPWHLDDYDQAKQAYTSFEMIELNHCWYQHTPKQNIATKPPLAGWISAALYRITGWWDGAWRLPPLLCALAMLLVIYRAGGLLAASAYGLNYSAPHLATLVRTDMLLTLFIFLIGFLIFQKVRDGTRWAARDQWTLFLLVLGSMMTKGPIAYAFLLPGIIAFACLCKRRDLPCNVWSGWWSWFVPLLVFAAWLGIGIARQPEFYDQIVIREFLGRFTVGEQAVHDNQPIYFYVTHLLVQFAPWSVLLVALLFAREAKAAIAKRPEVLWLVCWSLGGLIFMSLIPSKRPDRIFPVIPPLSLLLACLLAESRWPKTKIAAGAIAFGLLFTSGYTIYAVAEGFQTNQGSLVSFGERVRSTAAEKRWKYEVVGGRDEGLLLYLRKPEFTRARDAANDWQTGKLDALVISENDLKKSGERFQPYRVLFAPVEAARKNSRYFFIEHGQKAPEHSGSK